MTAINDAIKSIYGSTQTENTKGVGSKSVYGKTVGDVELSKEGADYYEKLKKKFGQYEFILVSKDEKENAMSNPSKYANPYKPVVLIDEEKVERMATDSAYRKKYEDILSGADKAFEQIKEAAAGSGMEVGGMGLKVNDDGTTSYFAVLKKSSAAQKERIKKHAAKAKEEKKAENKKKERKRLEDIKEKRAEKAAKNKPEKEDDEMETYEFRANSIEELIRKIQDTAYSLRADSIMTDAEKSVGGTIDFKG